jgi:hypothetical protein
VRAEDKEARSQVLKGWLQFNEAGYISSIWCA